MTDQDYISIAIPVLNETAGVFRLIEETISLPFKKEVLLIDDGSTNTETKKVLSDIKKHFPGITIITNKKNLGKSASIQKALKQARGNIFAVLDGDSELDPKDIVLLYNALKKNNARLASGVRIVRNKRKVFSYSNRLTRIAKKFFGSLIHFFYGVGVKDVLSGFKLFYSDDFKYYTFSTKKFGLETELLVETLNKGRKIVEVDISYYPRTYKEGKKINFFDGFEILRCTLFNIRLGVNTFRSPFGVVLIGILVWLFALRIYTLHANSSPTSDSIPNNLTALNIIYQKRLDIENFKSYLLKTQLIGYVGVESKENILYPKTPVINGILAAPYFFFSDRINGIHNFSAATFFQKDYETYYQSVGKLYASLLVSISVFFIFLTTYALFENLFYALAGAFAYGFGTMAYSTAAQGNWQHGPSLLLISLSFYLFLQFLKNRRKSLMIIVSTLLALATLIRISNLLFFIAVVLTLFFYREYRKVVTSSIVLFFLSISTWTFSMSLIGVPGGYNDEIMRSFQSFNLLYWLKVIASLLMSPNVGLFVFSPIFILSALGIYRFIWRSLKNETILEKPVRIFLLASTVSFFLLLFFNSFWWAWEGGFSYGPRLLTESIPFLIYLGVYFIYSLRSTLTKLAFSIIFFLLLFYSLIVHLVGVYAYDTDWQYKYYVGRSRLDMAWYNNPNIINYYVRTRKVFFTQELINDTTGLRIEKKYYLLDFQKQKFTLLETRTTSL